jgi:hypothetical protein
LVAAALIAGMVGCDGDGECGILNITSTAGGSVTVPGEGIRNYYCGTVVDLVATPDAGYQLVNWTGDVDTIADVYAASTTITMNGVYSITANFDENLEIRDWYDLDAVRNNLDGEYILMNDLDSTTAGYEELASPTANQGEGWEPIGTYYGQFTGTFNGQGYEIRGMFINCPGKRYVGLFDYVGEGGVIKDIGVVNATVTGGDYVGGLVGRNDGTVSNSYSTGGVTGNFGRVGGLVGRNEGTVSNSYSTGSVTGNEHVGGLVGWIYNGTVSNSYYNYDEVLINGENVITIGALFDEDFEEWLANDKFLDVSERLSQEDGYYLISNVSDFKQLLAFGQNDTLKFRLTNDLDLATEPNFYIPYLAGEFDGNGHKISNLSFNSDFVYTVGLFGYLAPGGKVTDLGADNVNMTGDYNVGGLVGRNWGTVSNSYSTGNVAGYHYWLGGLVGWNRGDVSDSYCTSTVTGLGYVPMSVGGLVGQNWGNVSNSYATGSVTGDSYVGGLVGANRGGTVSNCYSTGGVTGDYNVGGLVGESWGTVTNSFWDTETSGQATSDGGTGKTTAQMQDIVTFSGATWDIIAVADPVIRNLSYIWNIVDDETYPFLSWQP